MSKKAKYIRDRVSTYAPDLSKATRKEFGISKALIVKAIEGDDKALEQIGDMGKIGDRILTVMPKIRQDLTDYINGISEYNQSVADILKAGGKGSAAIKKAGSDLTLENTRYNNLIGEYKEQLFANLETEDEKHTDAIDLIKLKAWIDSHMRDVSSNARFEATSNKPYVAQMQADRDYEKEKALHLLENGSDSDLELIPRKHFTTNPVVRMWNSVRDFFR
ncbi:MAG: hypothetical protein HC836_37170 [Richelia sp. RM2_1_2]|nr:hypothetical protein [Richelia sp. SM2_1_7]NJO63623.1 hypothetical protein [Richelia sp. RM2_1_2]